MKARAGVSTPVAPRSRKNSLVIAGVLLWMAAVTGMFLLLDAPLGPVLAAERQYPALADVRAALTSLVYRKYVY